MGVQVPTANHSSPSIRPNNYKILNEFTFLFFPIDKWTWIEYVCVVFQFKNHTAHRTKHLIGKCIADIQQLSCIKFKSNSCLNSFSIIVIIGNIRPMDLSLPACISSTVSLVVEPKLFKMQNPVGKFIKKRDSDQNVLMGMCVKIAVYYWIEWIDHINLNLPQSPPFCPLIANIYLYRVFINWMHISIVITFAELNHMHGRIIYDNWQWHTHT